jgi:hypothetical protein
MQVLPLNDLSEGLGFVGKEPVRTGWNRSFSVRAGLPALFAQRYFTLTAASKVFWRNPIHFREVVTAHRFRETR